MAAAVANVPARNKFSSSARRDPNPNVALSVLLIVRSVGGLRANESPNFVRLNVSAGQIAKGAILIPNRSPASVNEKLDDRVFARARNAGNGPDRLALAKEVKDTGAGFTVELVHAVEYATACLSGQAQRSVYSSAAN